VKMGMSIARGINKRRRARQETSEFQQQSLSHLVPVSSEKLVIGGQDPIALEELPQAVVLVGTALFPGPPRTPPCAHNQVVAPL